MSVFTGSVQVHRFFVLAEAPEREGVPRHKRPPRNLGGLNIFTQSLIIRCRTRASFLSLSYLAFAVSKRPPRNLGGLNIFDLKLNYTL